MNCEALSPMSGRFPAETVTGENKSFSVNINGERIKLTLRQFEILGLRAMGLTEPEIADRLTLSDQTVKNHSSDPLRGAGDTIPIDVIAELIRTKKFDPEKLATGLDFTRTNRLSERFQEIFNKVTAHDSWHKNYKQVSEELNIKEQTLKNDLIPIFHIVGVPNILRARVFVLLKSMSEQKAENAPASQGEALQD